MPIRPAVALVAGAALALAFEPFRLVFLAPLALAAFLWTVRHQSARRGALLGAVFGAAFFLVHLVWIRVVGSDAWVALSLFQASYVALAGAGLARVSRLPAWPVWSAAVWVAVEAFRGSWPWGGLTWGRLAFGTIDTPFEAWLPWLGTSGVSLLVAGAAAGLLWLVLTAREHPRAAAGLVAGAAVVLTFPWVAAPPHSTQGSLRVAVVQGDVPGDGDDLVGHHRAVTRSHVDLTVQLARDVDAGRVERPDLVIWPENSTAVDPFADSETRAGIEEAVAAVGVPVLVGAMVDADEPGKVLNQGILIDPRTGAGERYTKRHPVPFGEFIPFRDVIGTWSSDRLGLVPRDMVAGDRRTPLPVGDVEVADAICFDIAYDDVVADQVRRGAGLVVVQTSNALFIHTGQIEQQFAISRVRAREAGRQVVIASVNGRSGVIDHRGDVAEAIAPRTRSVLVRDVPVTTSRPPSVWVGPWLGRAAVLVGLVSVVTTLTPYGRRKVVVDDEGVTR